MSVLATLGAFHLREVIEGRMQRRLDLLAEIAAIDAELRDVHRLLGEIPSIERTAEPVAATTLTLVAPVERRARPEAPALVRRILRQAGRPVGVKELRRTARAHGFAGNPELLSVALSRLAEEGQITRVSRGVYAACEQACEQAG